MLKKAETVCSVVNTDDFVTATFTHTRGFPIESFNYDVQKETGLPFIIDDNHLDYDTQEDKKELPIIKPSDAFDIDNDIPF